MNLIENDYKRIICRYTYRFPVGDGSDEYKYVLFSVGKGGKVYFLPTKGYKEDGYIYSEAAGYSTQFPTSVGVGEEQTPKY